MTMQNSAIVIHYFVKYGRKDTTMLRILVKKNKSMTYVYYIAIHKKLKQWMMSDFIINGKSLSSTCSAFPPTNILSDTIDKHLCIH